MEILHAKVHSPAFGAGVIAEQTDTTVTVDFGGDTKKFVYPACFEKFLTADDPAVQESVRAELAALTAAAEKQARAEKRRTLILAEQQKAEERKTKSAKSVRKK